MSTATLKVYFQKFKSISAQTYCAFSMQFSRRPLDVVGVGRAFKKRQRSGKCWDDGGNILVFSEQCGSQTATMKEEMWLIEREDDEMDRRATKWGRGRRQRRRVRRHSMKVAQSFCDSSFGRRRKRDAVTLRTLSGRFCT